MYFDSLGLPIAAALIRPQGDWQHRRERGNAEEKEEKWATATPNSSLPLFSMHAHTYAGVWYSVRRTDVFFFFAAVFQLTQSNSPSWISISIFEQCSEWGAAAVRYCILRKKHNILNVDIAPWDLRFAVTNLNFSSTVGRHGDISTWPWFACEMQWDNLNSSKKCNNKHSCLFLKIQAFH